MAPSAPTISNDRARRIALGAQGFREKRAAGRVDRRHLRRVLDRIGLLQLDSVNVACRAHYMPLFSRLGPYRRELIDQYAYDDGALFEYWGHEASLLRIEHRPLFGHRMAGEPHWKSLARMRRENPGYCDWVLEEVRERGALSIGDIADPGDRTGPWWGLGKGKLALEYLFVTGQVVAATRKNFTRFYDIPERVFPPEVLARPMLEREPAQRQLLMLGARFHGIGTAEDIADYYRIRMPEARPLLAQLVAAGELEQVEVKGWSKPAFLHPEADMPRAVPGRALLAPFDPLVWYRERVHRIFDFHYRIEIYVPEPKRVYGYYVLPFLLDGHLVARVDVKSDRDRGVLMVKGSFSESGADRAHVGRELGAELTTMAEWLGLTAGIEIHDNGDLAPFVTAG